MSAPKTRIDPWLDLAPSVVVEMLSARGWPVRASAEGVSLDLAESAGAFALLITTGREGDAAWKAIAATHPEGKVRGPRWRDDGVTCLVVRQGDRPVPTVDLAPGVRVLAGGAVAIPPSVVANIGRRWMPDAHAAVVEAATMPAWVAAIAHEPEARRAAEAVAARAALREIAAEAPAQPAARPSADGRPWIVVQSRAGSVVERTPVPELARRGLEALSATEQGERLFTIEGSNPPAMVHVLLPHGADDGSPDTAPRARIVATSKSVLRGWLSGAARWVTEGAGRSGRETHEADPPEAVVTFALDACESMRPLRGVVEAPVIRADGTILSRPGYDAQTRLFASFDAAAAREALASIPERPTADDAREAVKVLRGLVADFPFEGEAHRSMWIAGVLTMLTREAFTGPSPLFFVRANARGSGKSLLTEIAHIIATGERPAMLGWSGNDDEFEKLVTAEAIAGSACVVIDNITGTMRSACLDRILTSGKHRARILGGNTRFDGPMRAVWWANGNNVETSPDMGRRTGPIELVAHEERPDQRHGFAADADEGANGDTGSDALRKKAKRERWRLVAAALTIVRAWVCAGRPSSTLAAWGSFESWSRVVRGSLVFAGCVDPADARAEFRDSSETESSQLRGLLAGWRAAVRGRLLNPMGETLARAVKRLREADPEAAGADELREALESVAGEPVERWSGQTQARVGKFLRSNRRRVCSVEGAALAFETAGESGGSARWKVVEMARGADVAGSVRGDSLAARGDSRGDSADGCESNESADASETSANSPVPNDLEGAVRGDRGDRWSDSQPHACAAAHMRPRPSVRPEGEHPPYPPHPPSPLSPPDRATADGFSEPSDSTDDADDIEREAIRTECSPVSTASLAPAAPAASPTTPRRDHV